jgi:hypothetical protein
MNSQARKQSESMSRFDAAALSESGVCRHHVDPKDAAEYIESGERFGDVLISLAADMADLHDRLRHMLRQAPKRATP